jgi:hypothetical protein
MTSHRLFKLVVTMMWLATISLGCNREWEADPATSSPAPQNSPSGDDAEIEAALANLSPADRSIAEAQDTCPVSDQLLGTMGTPIKVTVEGREIFVCCDGCVAELKDNFDQYSAKLDPPASSGDGTQG